MTQHLHPDGGAQDHQGHGADETEPAAMTAPRVVRRDQNMERKSTGKLQLAAMENARPTMKAMFCFSNRMPRPMATTQHQGGHLGDAQLVGPVGPAFLG